MKFLSDKALQRLREGAETPDLAGTRYRLLERVARGGMGVVYAAEDEKLQRRVALKVLEVPGADGDLSNRLIREARVLAQLEHPGIVPVHDVGTLPDGRVFYTMKFVEGQRLDKFIESVPSIPDRLRLFLRICEAVAFAHSRHVLHRDLKPANIMVGPFGEVLVMDWGLAKVTAVVLQADETASSAGVHPERVASHGTSHSAILGTPGFMSPEQAGGQTAVDHGTDIFSLGAILWFMLAGSAPGEPFPESAGLPRPLRAICEKAMAADPNQRYQSARQMTADLANYLAGEPVTAHPESLVERVGRIYARHRTAVLLVAIYLLMRVLFIIFTRR